MPGFYNHAHRNTHVACLLIFTYRWRPNGIKHGIGGHGIVEIKINIGGVFDFRAQGVVCFLPDPVLDVALAAGLIAIAVRQLDVTEFPAQDISRKNACFIRMGSSKVFQSHHIYKRRQRIVYHCMDSRPLAGFGCIIPFTRNDFL